MLKCVVCGHQHMRLLVLAMLLTATLAPPVLADVDWNEDGWLATIGLEHLREGDEFGCYGMPNLEWKADPGAVALECRDYIENRIDASKWGDQPLSTYTPSDLTAAQHTIISNQGFSVHGDNNGQMATAWHSADDIPEYEYDWFDLGRRGGSLEKGIADVDLLSSELDEGGLVNMYWIGRIDDITVRHDSEVFEMLSQRNDVWFTTWGEAYSYWTVERCHEFNHSQSNNAIHFEHVETIACKSSANAWNIPVTWIAEVPGVEVIDSNLPQMTVEDSNTREGWRQEGDILYFSVLMGHEVHFNLSEETEYDILGRTQFFNNKSAALTVAGHSTTDLFLWSKRFDDNNLMRFTWLISPRSLDEGISWLPYAGIGVLVASVSGIWLLLKKDTLAHSKAEELMPVVTGGDDDE